MHKKCHILQLLVALAAFAGVQFVRGHGMMLDPPGRSSRWRYNKSAPINYDDNGLNCGGMTAQWVQNNGKCGLCGDNYAASQPRANEIGGRYGGVGVITKNYRNSHTARVGVRITTNHLGYFRFDICDLSASGGVESEKCFSENPLRFVDGAKRFYIGTKKGWIEADVVLPNNLSCEHCVLRWTYRGGNNWGPCGNGTSALGCGPQETFVNCADVSVNVHGGGAAAGRRTYGRHPAREQQIYIKADVHGPEYYRYVIYRYSV